MIVRNALLGDVLTDVSNVVGAANEELTYAKGYAAVTVALLVYIAIQVSKRRG